MKKFFFLSLLLTALAALLPQSMGATAKKILVVGNSFSYDAALQEFAPIVASGGDEITLGFPYKGGTTLQLHDERIKSGEVIYNYYKLTVNAAGTASQTTTGSNSKAFDASIVGDEAWDVVIIQTDHNYSCAYDHYFPYLNNIISFIKDNLKEGANPDFYLYMTWAYQDGSSKINELINLGLCTDQADQYSKIVDCAFRAAEASGIGTDMVIPGGTAVQNGRTSYIGDNYNRDGYHMNYNHGRYTVALTWYEKIFGKSALDVTYHPASISDYCAEMCRTAAHAAITTPKQVTSLAADFGENRDDLQASLTRSLLLNFTTPELTADGWNNLSSIAKGTSISDLTAQDGTASGVSATISNAFAGTTTGGATSTNAALEMTSNVSSTGFWVNGVSKNGVLDSEGAVTFAGLDPEKTYDFVLFGSQLSDTESYETEFSAGANEDFIDLTTSNNTRQTVTLANIAPDAAGSITLKVTPGATSTDTYKMGYINALALVMPYVPSYVDPWDGQSTCEPTKNASGQYVVYCGAELAWISAYVNAGNPAVNFILANDIDLGNQAFTPIGFGAAFNGTIDGQGHAVNNLLINASDLDSSSKFGGFISYTNSTSCDIENLTLRGTINMSSTAGSNVGGFIGKANALGNVRNCRSEVNININSAYNGYCGGIIGMGKTMNLENCVYSGTITIGSAGRVQKGVGGIIGTTNSSADGQEATIQGCAFIGTIQNQGTKTSNYTAGINGYSNLTKGSETETSNYVYGSISNSSTNSDLFCSKHDGTVNFSVSNCYYLDSMTASTNGTAASEAQFHSGEIAYLLNGDGTYMYFGQDLSDATSLPEPYTESNRVYRTTLMSGDEVTSTLYNNATLILADGTVWYDSKGKEYKNGDSTDRDLVLYDTKPYVASVEDPWDGTTTVEPQKNDAGYYVITCGAELAWISDDVNTNGNAADSFILANDIDMGNQPFTPIGSVSTGFTGKINGQEHAINNLYINASNLDSSAKFGGFISLTKSSDVDIANLTLRGTIDMSSTTGTNVGSFVGKADSFGTISNCTSEMTINISSSYAGYCGGIIGMGKALTMENCFYTGNIHLTTDGHVSKGIGGLIGTTNSSVEGLQAVVKGSAFTGKILNDGSNQSSYTGGLIGYSNLSKGSQTDSNNYVYATIEILAVNSGIFVGKAASTYSISDCYYLSTMGEDSNGIAATADQFHSGEVCYKINNGLATPLFGQDLSDVSTLPVAYDESNRVYRTIFMVDNEVSTTLYNNSTLICPNDNKWYDADGNEYKTGDTVDSDLTLYDVNGNAPVIEDPWDGTTLLEPAKNSDGYYVITLGAELAWVANDVNSGNKTDSFILANDIDLGNQPFTPIGFGAQFNGKADGQGYNIYNLNIVASDLDTSNKFGAFISYTNSTDCEVKNIHLHGSITMTSTAGSNIGSLIGKANNIGTISNCTSDMAININSVYNGYCGGILGQGKAIVMENCFYSGTITIAAEAQVQKGVGGLVGTTNSTTSGLTASITGCAFTGKIVNNGENSSLYTGGIISYARLTKGTETDSRNYVYGSISNTATNSAIFTGLNACGTYTLSDCYYLDTMGSTENGTAATAAQFHSGEVAYNLNSDLETPLFGQDLSSDTSLPEAYNVDNRVFRTTFMVEDAVYAVTYNNTQVKFPENPTLTDIFEGWQDAEGNAYTAGATTNSDLTLYAKIETGVNSLNADDAADDDTLYDLLGRKVTTDNPVHGIYIRGGKKVLF
ncbi:MAG: DUF4886 domain-containing protein [Bacteroidales bacterium]|nr:DUF4886 domain-containing protein [Bacteroidales bacterium]